MKSQAAVTMFTASLHDVTTQKIVIQIIHKLGDDAVSTTKVCMVCMIK